MSKAGPPTYELRKQGGTTGVGGAGCRLVGEVGRDRGGGARGGRSGVPLPALSEQRKKVTKTAHFFFRKFCKANNFAYICIEKNTKPIQL